MKISPWHWPSRSDGQGRRCVVPIGPPAATQSRRRVRSSRGSRFRCPLGRPEHRMDRRGCSKVVVDVGPTLPTTVSPAQPIRMWTSWTPLSGGHARNTGKSQARPTISMNGTEPVGGNTALRPFPASARSDLVVHLVARTLTSAATCDGVDRRSKPLPRMTSLLVEVNRPWDEWNRESRLRIGATRHVSCLTERVAA